MVEAQHHSLFNLRARGDWVRLRTLLVLRWMAITGQAATVLFATQVLSFQLPLAVCALAISASVSLNIIMHIVYPSETRLSERGTLLSLLFDLSQLAIMLMLCGGLSNPFAVLILAPVTIAATALRLRSTIVVSIAALLSIPLMALLYLPLVQADGSLLQIPSLLRYGVAAALAIGVIFVALYSRRVTVESYAMSEALSATQIALSREQRLAAIGGIAAAAAHELGTPLATIKLVASELASELEDHSELAEDVALIRSEADRCGAIMADLSQGGRDDRHVKLAPVSAVIEEAAQPHATRGKQLHIRINGVLAEHTTGDQPTIRRSPELIHGLRNAIQNAVDFAEATVWIDATIVEGRLRIAVGDDGPGFGPDILPKLGEPYVSTRARGDRRDRDGSYEGMGLGLFIARTLLERTGASLAFANGSDARRRTGRHRSDGDLQHPPGAIIEMTWPIESLVVRKEQVRGALGPNDRFEP
ncbi:MAG: ActS/PrrB/RegB family redox-sensitive histidine kinase [Pseudomonadota bacterium]